MLVAASPSGAASSRLSSPVSRICTGASPLTAACNADNICRRSREHLFKTQLDKIYGEKHAKKLAANTQDDENGTKARQLFKNLTPKRQKRTLDFMLGIADAQGNPSTPSVSGTLVPKKLNFDTTGAGGQANTENETETK